MAEENNNIEPQIEQVRYDDENIRHLSDMEHVRTAMAPCQRTVSTCC